MLAVIAIIAGLLAGCGGGTALDAGHAVIEGFGNWARDHAHEFADASAEAIESAREQYGDDGKAWCVSSCRTRSTTRTPEVTPYQVKRMSRPR